MKKKTTTSLSKENHKRDGKRMRKHQIIETEEISEKEIEM